MVHDALPVTIAPLPQVPPVTSKSESSRPATEIALTVMEAAPSLTSETTCGSGGALALAPVDAQREERLVRAVRALLRATLTDSGQRREWRWTTQPALSVDPSRDRRAAVRRQAARALGAPPPLLHHDQVAVRRADPSGDAVVYLDVSGSMGQWTGRLHAALVPLRRLLAPQLYAFSTQVHALRHADLLAGRLPTTGGTDIAPVLRHLLAHRGIAPLLDIIVGGDTCERRKPDPQPLLWAASQLGLPPEQMLMVGDSVNDVSAGLAAGMSVVAVPYGYNEGQDPRLLPAHGMVETMAELPSLLGLPGAKAAQP